jgi:hypothetical protein
MLFRDINGSLKSIKRADYYNNLDYYNDICAIYNIVFPKENSEQKRIIGLIEKKTTRS